MSLSNRAYHELQKLSHSLIVAIRDKGCYSAFKESAFNPERVEPEPSNALVFGALYHCLVRNKEIVEKSDNHMNKLTVCLNPTARTPKDEELSWISVDDYTVIFIYDFGLSRSNKAYDAMLKYLKTNNQWTDDALLVSPAEFEQCVAMVKALYANPYYQAFFQNYELVGEEMDIMFELDGFPCKARLDALLKDTKTGQYFIIDWKSTKNTTCEQNQLCGEKMGYHIQSHMYKNAVAQKFNVPVSDVNMLFFMQNKELPEIIYVASFGEESDGLADSEFCEYARDFNFRLKKYLNGDTMAFVENCGILQFKHWAPRLLEQPDL